MERSVVLESDNTLEFHCFYVDIGRRFLQMQITTLVQSIFMFHVLSSLLS